MGNEVTKDQVRARALQLWEQSGRPLGKDLEFWLQAERELRGEEEPQAIGPISDDATRGGRPEDAR